MENCQIFIDAEYLLQSLKWLCGKSKEKIVKKEDFKWQNFVSHILNGRKSEKLFYYTARLDEKENKAAIKGNYTPDIHYCDFIAYLTKDGILSLVFVEGGDNDYNEYHVYNIDVKTGEKVDNARLAKVAGVSSIRKAAMDALQNVYNNNENHNYRLKDYKIVKKKGKKLDEEERAVEASFSEKHLNDKMKIGLTNEGKLFFISEFEKGAGESFGMYDGNGKDLYDEDNPYCFGEHSTDDEDEDEDDEDYDDAYPDIEDVDED